MNALLSNLFTMLALIYEFCWHRAWARIVLRFFPVSGHGMGMDEDSLDFKDGSWVWCRMKSGEMQMWRWVKEEKTWESLTDCLLKPLMIWRLHVFVWLCKWGKLLPETLFWEDVWQWIIRTFFDDDGLWEMWHAWKDNERVTVRIATVEPLEAGTYNLFTLGQPGEWEVYYSLEEYDLTVGEGPWYKREDAEKFADSHVVQIVCPPPYSD